MLRRRSLVTGLAALIAITLISSSCASRGHSPPPTAAANRAAFVEAETVTTLGDSVPAGSACQCAPYPQLSASDLTKASGRTVTSFNDAVPGYRSGDVLEQVDDDQTIIVNVENSDAVMLEIGANDIAHSTACGDDALCYEAKLPQVEQNIRAIVSRLHELGGTDFPVVLLDYWSVWLGGQYAHAQGAAYEQAAGALTHSFNAMIRSVATDTHCIYVDVRAAFKGPNDEYDETALLAPDGEHPNAAGHRRITDAIAHAVHID